MAVGMTLHQLYAPPSYAEQPAGGPAPSAASAAASPAASSASASSAPASSSAADSTAPPAGRAYAKQPPPMAGHAAKTSSPYAYPPPTMVSSAGYAAYPPPSAYPPSAVYPPKADEGYVADPLPFEYAGMRRFHPAAKDYADVVYASAAAAGHGGAPVYTATSVAADRGVYQAYDPRPQYAAELPAHYPPRSVAPYAALPLTHAFPPLLDAAHPSGLGPTKKEVVDAYAPSAAAYGAAAEPRANAGVPAPQGAGGAAQEAMIKVKTPLKLKYWRNGRRNLQCFPSCKVFGDYSAIKIEDLKQHDFMWGKCRGSIVTEVTLNSNVSLDDLVLLGRVHSLENIPVAFEEAVIRECMLGRMVEPDVMDAMKDQWITGERLPDFVQQDANVACFEFKPKVWKYTEDMAQGKCKRRNVKYYVQFEAFVLVLSGDRRYYACIGSGMSTSFEVGSSRVLARQKRKAASNGASLAAAAAAASQDKQQQQQQLVANDMAAAMQPMHHHPAMLPPNMMPTHPMAGAVPMYQPYPAGRSLPPTFPHPQLMAGLPPQALHDAPQLHQPAVDVHQQHQQQQQQPSVGSKRKMSSERPAFPTDRAAKALKTASM